MITHVVFDWNGTLLADADLRYRLNNEKAIKRFGHPGLTRAEHQALHSIPIHDFYNRIGVSKEMVEKHGQAAVADFHEAYEILAARCRTRRGTRDIIESIHKKGGTAIILSNHTVEGINAQLERLKLSHYFDIVMANDSIHTATKKGKKDMLADYIKRLSLDPKHMVIVGDTEEETHIARDLGIHSVAITGGTHSRKRLAAVHPDAIVTSLYGLIDILEEL